MSVNPRCSSRKTLVFAALALAAPQPVRANGAFPDEFSIHFPANAPNRILIGANFGLLVSEDLGTTWRYACEPWVTVGSNDPLSPALVSFYQVSSAPCSPTRSASPAPRTGRAPGRPQRAPSPGR
jgi:hypothetical protein